MSDASSGQQPPRITVDANLFVSGMMRTGTPPNELLRAWVHGAFLLVTSAELRSEIADVVRRPKFERYHFDQQLIAEILEALYALELVEPLTDLPLHCRDPKDDMVLACALAAGVDYIVTGDNDLYELAGHPALGSIRIISAREFLRAIGIELDQP